MSRLRLRPPRARGRPGVVVVALSPVSWRSLPSPDSPRSPGARCSPSGVERDPGLSILLVSVDTLRADALGVYGRAGAATPWIDRLAAEGVRFETAHAHNVVTLPSHANLLSGRYPLRHGVRDNTGFRFPREQPTLATILRESGWRTGAFVSAFPLDSRFGLDRGFDVYDDRLGGARRAPPSSCRSGAGGDGAARRSLDRSVRGQRFFAFVHLYEPHFPYEPPEPFAAPVRGRALPGRGRGRGRRPRAAPRADPRGRGPRAHARRPHLGPRRVPRRPRRGDARRLRLRGDAACAPRAVGARLLRSRWCAPPSVTSTCCRRSSTPRGSRSPGCPAAACCPSIAGGGGPAPDSYLEALSSSLNRGWAPLHGTIHDGMKYVDLPLPELYDLREDPGEARNLAARAPGCRAHALPPRGAPADDVGVGSRVREKAATLERLRALGYVAEAGRPRRELHRGRRPEERSSTIDARIRDVVILFRRAGDYDGAVAACGETIRRRPDMPLSYLQLAYLERRRGRLDAAVAATREAVELRPLDAESVPSTPST